MARGTVPIVNPEHQALARPDSNSLSLEQARQCIAGAGLKCGYPWISRLLADGSLELSTAVRGKHLASVHITFTPTEFSIYYKDSLDLKYEKSGAVESIHPFYNSWVSELVNAIKKEAATFSATGNPQAIHLNPAVFTKPNKVLIVILSSDQDLFLSSDLGNNLVEALKKKNIAAQPHVSVRLAEVENPIIASETITFGPTYVMHIQQTSRQTGSGGSCKAEYLIAVHKPDHPEIRYEIKETFNLGAGGTIGEMVPRLMERLAFEGLF